jgi:predicted DNA-binding transcriptional regulator YafY
VGTNRPVDLSPEQVEALVLALDEWFEDVGRQGLPPKIEELRNALHDDLADEAP